MIEQENSQPEPQVGTTGVTRHTINIREVVRSKSERLANMLPGFVYRYLRKIVHEDELNKFLYDSRDKFGLDFVEAVIQLFQMNITVHGLEKIPKTGKVIAVSNHPLGGLDGVAIVHTIGKVRPDVFVVVNDLLMFIPNAKSMMIPINKHGRNADNIALVNEAFAGENIIPLFPAGLCSRKVGGVICDLEWKSTFVSQARRNDRIVLPIHCSGRNTNFFYNLARLRKFFRIKANLEMFFLVNEMFKQNKKDFVITIGDPIPASAFTKEKKPLEWAAWVKEKVYALANSSETPN